LERSQSFMSRSILIILHHVKLPKYPQHKGRTPLQLKYNWKGS
jgi:hypothetical protein